MPPVKEQVRRLVGSTLIAVNLSEAARSGRPKLLQTRPTWSTTFSRIRISVTTRRQWAAGSPPADLRASNTRA